MQQLESAFKKISRFISRAEEKMEFYTLSISEKKNILIDNPQKHIALRTRNDANEAEILFTTALGVIPVFAPFGEALTRQEFLLALIQGMRLIPFVLSDGRIAVPLYKDFSTQDALRLLNDLDGIFYKRFNCRLELAKTDASEMTILEQRMSGARRYYLEEHGDWTARFTESLEDELSRVSFVSFLRQRIKAHILKGTPACYPVAPPAQSAAWRRQRENADYDFPVLNGCREDVRNFFYRDTFIYEQYAVPGKVEASPGDVVIDAGAFIGDTACYFSRKVGKEGRVLAFEIVPETIDFARQNMRINGCDNVEILPNALSDASSTFTVVLNPHSNSAAFVADASDDDAKDVVSVDAVTLDDLAAERAITVDFIKADIEGAEMRMLRGAARTIARDAPVCAICLYHRQEDYWQIPQFLKELRPDYAFWFRCEAEPVLFARKKN